MTEMIEPSTIHFDPEQLAEAKQIEAKLLNLLADVRAAQREDHVLLRQALRSQQEVLATVDELLLERTEPLVDRDRAGVTCQLLLTASETVRCLLSESVYVEVHEWDLVERTLEELELEIENTQTQRKELDAYLRAEARGGRCA